VRFRDHRIVLSGVRILEIPADMDLDVLATPRMISDKAQPWALRPVQNRKARRQTRKSGQ
jgi:hypothetical protein